MPRVNSRCKAVVSLRQQQRRIRATLERIYLVDEVVAEPNIAAESSSIQPEVNCSSSMNHLSDCEVYNVPGIEAVLTMDDGDSSEPVDEESDVDSYLSLYDSDSQNSCYGSDENLFKNIDWSSSESENGLEDEVKKKQDDFCRTLGHWVVESNVPRVHVGKLLKCIRPHFDLSFLPRDYRTLLKTQRKVTLKEMPPGHYFHFGLIKYLFEFLNSLSPTQIPLCIELCVNVDGIPLYKSSRSQFWPILGLLRNIDGAKPFVIGIFEGTSKPLDVNLFLEDFVREVKFLETNGVILNGKVIPFKISAILCDAPARSFLTDVKGHTAYFGCPKCETKGKYAKNHNSKKGRVTFPTSNARLRNNHSFKTRRQAEHHKGRSLLEELNLDMVLNIPLDSMHLCDLGVMKKLMLAWAKGKFERVKLSKALFCLLDRLMCSVSNFMPTIFCRKLRGVVDLDRLKSTELRQFRLFLGPVILKTILPIQLYQHFLLFHYGTRILSDPDLSGLPEMISYADKILKLFVHQSKTLYGKKFVSFNVHCLTHLAQEATTYGSIDTITCYPFENFLQILKTLCKKSSKPLPTVVKRLSEIQTVKHREKKKNPEQTILLFGEHRKGPLVPALFGKQYRRVKFGYFTLRTKVPDNCVILNDMSVFIVKNFVQDRDGQVFVIGSKYSTYNDLFIYPAPSRIVGEVVVTENDLSTCLLAFPLSFIKFQAAKIPINSSDDDKFAVISIRNEVNMY